VGRSDRSIAAQHISHTSSLSTNNTNTRPTHGTTLDDRDRAGTVQHTETEIPLAVLAGIERFGHKTWGQNWWRGGYGGGGDSAVEWEEEGVWEREDGQQVQLDHELAFRALPLFTLPSRLFSNVPWNRHNYCRRIEAPRTRRP